MKSLALTLTLVLGASLAGCSDDPAPVAQHARKVDQSANTFEAKAHKALSAENPADVSYDRGQLRDWRTGGQKGAEWPLCAKLTKAYGQVAMSKSMLGIQDALMASQIDDFVLCDKPSIYAATRASAEAAVERLQPKLPARQMVDYMIQKAGGPRMDDCWLKALRTSRQDSSPYNEAYKRAEARCKML